MLHNAKNIHGFTLECRDGTIGSVKELYFDDHQWTVRYLVVDTGGWLIGKQVLISPHAITSVDEKARHIHISLTRQQIEDSPPLESHKPVSRQFEEAYYGYYRWPIYLGAPYMWGESPLINVDQEGPGQTTLGRRKGDPNLRSMGEVCKHDLMAEDGKIGHVDDFIFDDKAWTIRYLIVDTSNWWAGKRVLISPLWISGISWVESRVMVRLSREVIKNSPEFTADMLVTREYETDLHQHYRLQGYWIDEVPVPGPSLRASQG